MDFELSEDEVALADGMRRLCAGRFPLERIRAAEGERVVIDASGWSELAEAGVFSLRLAEEAGGLNLGTAAAAVVFEELGRALVPGPILASHLAAGLVEGAADGKVMVGAVSRPRADATSPVVIEHLGSLDALVVVGEDGLALVDPASLDAVAVDRSLDPLTPLWRVDHLPVGDAVGGPDDTATWWRDASVLGGALLVGLAGATVDLAVGYAKERQQFGKAIGSFQAVKHLCADMLVRSEVARAAVHAAAVTIDQPDVGDAVRAAAGAGLLAVEAAMANGKACIQVHGGMGFTWEVPAHLYLMRARVLAGELEGTDALAELVAQRY
ncbi:MAG TPA: acyl-CoA dehydrogenase family protein [Acidimicrobiales bacterium]|nr:acyl-CoA dehydrogenase family protein [Acidimicrobiales bacterium]